MRIAIVGVVIAIGGGTAVIVPTCVRHRSAPGKVDAAWYARSRTAVAKRVGTSAIATFPEQLPENAIESRGWAMIDPDSKTATLLLLCRFSASEARQVVADFTLRRASLPPQPRGVPRLPWPSLAPVLKENIQPMQISEGYKRLYGSAEGSEVSSGVAVNESTGTVIWWTQRWAPGHQ